MTVESYLQIWSAILLGIGLGWFFAGIAQPFSRRFGFIALLIWWALAYGIHFLPLTN